MHMVGDLERAPNHVGSQVLVTSSKIRQRRRAQWDPSEGTAVAGGEDGGWRWGAPQSAWLIR